MAQGRYKESELTVKQHSAKFIIGQIDQAIVEIFNIFNLAFAEGNPVPQGPETRRVALFRDLWEKLKVEGLQFASLKELDTYYHQLAKLEDVYVADFLNVLKIQDLTFSDQEHKILLSIIQLYHVLIKNKFLFAQFNEDDHPILFAHIIQRFKEACGLISRDDYFPEERQYKKMMRMLDALGETITSRLISINYLKSKPTPIQFQVNHDDEFLKSISALLSELPPIDNLNQAISELEKSLNAKDQINITQNMQTLNEYVQRIREIKAKLHQNLTQFLKDQKKIFKAINKERDVVQETITNINLQHDFFRILNLLSDINEKNPLQQVFKNASDNCRQQSQRWLTNGPWNIADQSLEKILKTLENDCACFIEAYADHLIKVRPYLEYIKLLYKRNEQLEQISFNLKEKLQNMNNLWQTTYDDITHIENVLLNHINSIDKESLPTYCTSFLSRHWLKIVLGGVGTGGLGLGMGFLLALDSFGIAFLCILSVALGGSAGAASGALTEYCCPENSHHEENPETISLLSEELDDDKTNVFDFFHEEELKNINRLQRVLVIKDDESKESSKPSTSRWWPSFSLWGYTNKPAQKTENLNHNYLSFLSKGSSSTIT